MSRAWLATVLVLGACATELEPAVDGPAPAVKVGEAPGAATTPGDCLVPCTAVYPNAQASPCVSGTCYYDTCADADAGAPFVCK